MERLEISELAKINSLFQELESKLTDLRFQVSLPPKKVGEITIFSCSFERIDFIEAIRIGAEKTFYIKIDDVEHCKNIFYILERENILCFQENSTDVRILEIGNAFIGFVGYKVEKLSLFKKIICNKSFVLYGRFQVDEQHDHQMRGKERELEIYQQQNANLLELAKLMASKPINVETNTKTESQVMSGDRHINTAGGNYIESNSGVYVQGSYINMSQDLTEAATQIQDLIEQLQKQGVTVDVAQKQVARDMASQAQNDLKIKDKLVKWGQSLGDATVSDVVKGAVKLAIRSAGIPLP